MSEYDDSTPPPQVELREEKKEVTANELSENERLTPTQSAELEMIAEEVAARMEEAIAAGEEVRQLDEVSMGEIEDALERATETKREAEIEKTKLETDEAKQSNELQAEKREQEQEFIAKEEELNSKETENEQELQRLEEEIDLKNQIAELEKRKEEVDHLASFVENLMEDKKDFGALSVFRGGRKKADEAFMEVKRGVDNAEIHNPSDLKKLQMDISTAAMLFTGVALNLCKMAIDRWRKS